MPVTKPLTLAEAYSCPVVCSSCATPYSAPSASPCNHCRRGRRSSGRANNTHITSAATMKRTARKSATGIRCTTSLIRKNVDPQIAVTMTSAAVATAAIRPGASLMQRLLAKRPAG